MGRTRRHHNRRTVSKPQTELAEFRQAMASLPTGVTVVTAIGPDRLSGATANAVCSLSLDPPLMLACLDLGSRTLRSVQAAGRYGINVLAAGQEDLARAFATKAAQPDKWDGVAWSERSGVPALDGALLWVGCELRDSIAGGDHVIVTGEVIGLEIRDADPLVFHRGAYRPLG
jgi:3-hydroxy-9,10-secoandrosta-1,3,5(10)-triene-9,17-dione monooxygenase reductase component